VQIHFARGDRKHVVHARAMCHDSVSMFIALAPHLSFPLNRRYFISLPKWLLVCVSFARHLVTRVCYFLLAISYLPNLMSE